MEYFNHFLINQIKKIPKKIHGGGIFFPKKPGIQSFGGFGDPKRIVLRGLVVDKKGLVGVDESDTVFDNIKKMKRRFFSAPRRGVEVAVQFAGRKKIVKTDSRGYFVADLDFKQNQNSPCEGVCNVSLELVKCSAGFECSASASVYIPPESARFGVISDIDDTIIYTFATDRLRMIFNVLVNNARTRLPYSGVRTFYRALHGGFSGNEQNPFFYVSSSSWRVYDVMRDFMEINDMPPGPILMRAIEFSRSSLFDPRRHDHKKNRFIEILSSYPHLPFLLIGDNGQRDAELYTELANLYPGRIPALYLRDVDSSSQRKEAIMRLASVAGEAGSELLLTDSSLEAARHAATHGWINPARLPEIEKELNRAAPENKLISILSSLSQSAARLISSAFRKGGKR